MLSDTVCREQNNDHPFLPGLRYRYAYVDHAAARLPAGETDA